MPIATAEMLIRKPAADVFQAFVDPQVTTKFWFMKSTGKLEPGKRIQWDGDDATFVSITNAGFTGEADAVVKHAISSTEGFTLVLTGLKALLEHGVILNLVADRFPRRIDMS